ncbi:Zinc finger protein 454 [Echinococcus granulosus]|uniref:Zinc finger protein 454 n=1 Tax=Echinococcus granulosus TaxID=6210 RepID=W6UN32_ECHGR|nr:Zinc finger protein 454 [Echinococcus granulosus]EUB62488.1 Zinc finger protein 454 [Echinococcus granulosus]
MSTPKLTAALKESSILQQRITDTLSSRLRQEQCVGTTIPAKNFGVQGAQSFVGAPLISEELVSDNPFLASGEAFPRRTVTSASYAAIPFFPQLNQFGGGRSRARVPSPVNSPHLLPVWPFPSADRHARVCPSREDWPRTCASIDSLQRWYCVRAYACARPRLSVQRVSVGRTKFVPTTLRFCGELLPSVASDVCRHRLTDEILSRSAVSQRAATLVTITSPHGGTTTGAVVGTLGPPPSQVTPIAPVSTAQPVIMPLQTTPRPSDPSALQPPPTSSKPDGSCDPCPPLITTTAGAVSSNSACAPNGHILTAAGLECVDMKPDPVACLARVGVDEPPAIFGAPSTTTTTVAADFGASANTPLNFLSATAAAAPTEPLPSSPPASTTTSTDNIVVPISAAPIAATSATTTAVVAATPAAVVVMKATSGNEGDSGSGSGGGTAGSGPYQCMHCGKEFRVLRYLEKHKRIHTGEKPYQCCFCGRLFNDWPNMNRHKRIHTGERPYRCSVCTKTFSQPAVYNEHVKRHTGERPYVCTVCSKGFPRAARLVVHMRVHTGEKPYRCHVCDRRFSQPHHLSTHIRIHSEDRPFRFSLRDSTASGSANSRRHRRQANHTTDPITPATADATATLSQGTRVKHLSNPTATEASPTGGQRKVLAVDAGGSVGTEESSGVCSGESALHPESSESLLSQDGELQASTSSSVETSRDAGGGEGVGLTSSTPLSTSGVAVASPGSTEATRATATSNPAVASAAAGLTVSEDFCSQPPPSIFDANGTIYISTVDGTAAISGGVTTALVPATTTITSTLPQIQIHPQPQPAAAAFATTAAAFSGDPHHLQPQGPIQICYSTSPAATASPSTTDPTTIILPSSSESQLFGPMLVPIGTASTPTPLSPPQSLTPAFPYATTATAAAVNPPAAFQTTHTLPSQAVVTKSEAVTSSNASMEASSIAADV